MRNSRFLISMVIVGMLSSPPCLPEALPSPVQASPPPVKLDEYLKDLTTKCDVSPELDAFREDLNSSFSFDANQIELRKNKPAAIVHIPRAIRRAVGQATAKDMGDWTQVSVPLAGVFRRLPTRFLQFGLGHGNGIQTVALEFNAPVAEVEKSIGADVKRVERRMQRAADPDVMGYKVEPLHSAKVESVDGRGRLACNLSD